MINIEKQNKFLKLDLKMSTLSTIYANLVGMNQFKPVFVGTADPNSDMAKWTR